MMNKKAEGNYTSLIISLLFAVFIISLFSYAIIAQSHETNIPININSDGTNFNLSKFDIISNDLNATAADSDNLNTNYTVSDVSKVDKPTGLIITILTIIGKIPYITYTFFVISASFIGIPSIVIAMLGTLLSIISIIWLVAAWLNRTP